MSSDIIGGLVFIACSINILIAMPFTHRVVDARYRPTVDYLSSWDWLATWFLNLFAAMFWPLTLAVHVLLPQTPKRHSSL